IKSCCIECRTLTSRALHEHVPIPRAVGIACGVARARDVSESQAPADLVRTERRGVGRHSPAPRSTDGAAERPQLIPSLALVRTDDLLRSSVLKEPPAL